ncbi:MAG TPA: FtsQ-type POTRA domain-containing protein [Longimicrobiaceae bacterium]|nr:FtsQ-type POTRA domain-containing protein [Longimicrobiaceae bacterium]
MRIRLLLRRLALALLAVACAAVPWWGPEVLQHFSWFEVDRVEVSGVHLLDPYEVLVASGVSTTDNVWADHGSWEAALRRHPGIAHAEISRKLPGTLRIRIREKQPVAYIEVGTLRAATGAGELFPVDPTRKVMDLPIVRAKTWPATLGLLKEAERLGNLDPGLLARTSEIALNSDGALVLTLSSPSTRILLPAGAGTNRLQQLRAVLADIRVAPMHANEPKHLVDLRFADQVVVRTFTSA